ncbi:phage major capsid protein, P2 family [Maridesulfovibrio ferrireducens]|uniref:phage major capsid protein, P2 family n=1 Tax=Maridesulfovibrio ferrireducens TaxID=246191 RepID=UPI001A2C5C54|nr:phage major capsid protein, P2 family [Maridesulfovibrio ferrireducens]MBI9109899.1 phage major capsid protein, P2 family [Maridesulfovibrio ferrireducens]
MNSHSRKQYSALQANLAKGYGVQNVTEQFTVEPSVEQRLQDKIVEQSTFLQKINVITVDEMTGQNILGYANGPASGRTDTSGDKERVPVNLLGMDSNIFTLHQTDSDVYMLYSHLDAWAKFHDFQERYARYVQARIANDREVIGWNGVSAAADTNITTYPLMQDVNKGWLQYMREKRAANILAEGGSVAGAIKVGTDGDFKSIDHIVADLKQGIPKWLRKDLVALVGDELVGTESTGLYKAIVDDPVKKLAATASLEKFGGLPWETPSNFPGRGLVITSYSNLSIYTQSGSWRRNLKDKPEKNRVEDFNSRNEGYTVENTEAFVALEFDNVLISDGAGGWA